MNLYHGGNINYTVMILDTVSTFSNHDLKESLISKRKARFCTTETRTSYLNSWVPLHHLVGMHSYVVRSAARGIIKAGPLKPVTFMYSDNLPKSQPSLYNLL